MVYEEAIFGGEESWFPVEVVVDMREIALLRETQNGSIRTEWKLRSMTRKLTLENSRKMGESGAKLNVAGESTEVC